MAVLKKIVIQDFRNITFQEMSFSPNINCISGSNGAGKTNLMDAIWYLSMTKSAFSQSDRFNFRHGKSTFAISGTYSTGSTSGTPDTRISVQVTRDGEKKLRKDDKAYSRISEHIGLLPIVMVSPSDISLVSESGDDRRRFMNAVLSQMNPGYLATMQQYNRLLFQRNKILKESVSDDSLLDVFDAKMDEYAAMIFEAREKFVGDLQPVVAQYYKALSSGSEDVTISYKSDLEKGSLSDILKSCRDKDKLLKYTSAGIQRDDLVFGMDDYPIRRCGSQGQQKSFLVSLKFAQYEIMKKNYGYPPILLLDDVFDKLDISRISNLIGMVAGNEFGQIFITDSNKVRMQGIVDKMTEDRKYFVCNSGEFMEA